MSRSLVATSMPPAGRSRHRVGGVPQIVAQGGPASTHERPGPSGPGRSVVLDGAGWHWVVPSSGGA
jgi:hypothetical protein